METLCDNLAVLGQRVYNFIDELRIGHDCFESLLFAISCCRLGCLDKRFAYLCKLLLESICDRLQAFLQWTIESVEKFEILEVVLVKELTDATLLVIEKLCLVLDKDLLLENDEKLLVEVGPAETLLKACLL